METVQPPLDEFKGHPGADPNATQLKDIKKTLPLRVLSEEDWKHWTTKGYVIVKQAVPMDNVKRTIDILWKFEEKDPGDPQGRFVEAQGKALALLAVQVAVEA